MEDVASMKDNIATIREDSKKTEERLIQYVNGQLSEQFAKWDGKQTGSGVVQEKQGESTPEVMVVGEIPSASPPQEHPLTDFNQPLPTDVEAYLKESSEDEKLVVSVQWLFLQVNTDISLIQNKALDPIRWVGPPRDRVMSAMQTYQGIKDSLQGRQAWAATDAATSKQGAQAVQE